MQKNQQKYDRQIRLWKEHGQQSLESAHVCLLGGTATGTETIKNLVLPGIAAFTIVDDKQVERVDLGTNFFLCEEHVGKSRARALADFLQELNEDVEGFSVEESPETVIRRGDEFFDKFQVVVASGLAESTLLELDALLTRMKIPLIICRSFGFMGYLRLVLPEHCVIESHPDNVVDLRIDCPWPELLEYSLAHDFSKMDSMELSHVAYVVILIKCLNEWKQQNGNTLPRNSAERDAFKKLVLSYSTVEDAENFTEALSQAFRACQPNSIPAKTQKLLERSQSVTENSSFWFLVKSLKMFVDVEGKLPLVGTVPDMKADTERYVKLQQIYRAKAAHDRAEFRKYLDTLVVDSASTISDEEIDRFCKNAGSLHVLQYRSFAQERESPCITKLTAALEDAESLAPWYVSFMAAEKFFEQFKRYPGAFNGDLETDIGLLKKTAHAMLSAWGITNSAALLRDEYIHETCRAGASEMHNVASLVGGVASQECLKILTKQYVPVCNTFIFDGMTSSGWAFEA